MKKNRTTRLVVLVLFLAIVTAVIISGTFAKYTDSKSGTGTATVAKWAVALKADEQTFSEGYEFTLADTYTNVAAERIAPGTSGDFNVAINAAGSEVAVDYVLEIKVKDASTVPTNMKFYKTVDGEKVAFTFADGAYKIEDTIALADVGTEVTLPISWEWPYETDAGAGDADDTANGVNPTTMEFEITLTATQANPNA